MTEITPSRFQNDRAKAWGELDSMLSKIERNAMGQLADRDLIKLPALYRNAISSLSLIRASGGDERVRGYLEALCRRAYFLIYGIDETLGSRATRFLRHDWRQTARDLLPEFLISASLIVLGFIAAWAQVVRAPNSFYGLVPSGLAQGRDPSTQTALLEATLHRSADLSSLTGFSAQLFANNVQVAFLAVALGLFLCVPSALVMLYNGALLGALMAVYSTHGLTTEFLGWLSIHGPTELTASALAGACGIRLGRAFILPGRDLRLVSLQEHGRRVAPVVFGVVLMLVGAGLLEGIGRQVVDSTVARLVIGMATLCLWLWFFCARQPNRSKREPVQ